MEELKKREKFMKEALKEAKKAFDRDEVPVGAVAVLDGKIIGRAHNLKVTKKDATCHAEILLLKKLYKKFDDWRLDGVEIFVTLEPCPMCAGAMIQSRIKALFYGAKDEKGGGISNLDIFSVPFNHQVETLGKILEKECGEILTTFFKNKRKMNKRTEM